MFSNNKKIKIEQKVNFILDLLNIEIKHSQYGLGEVFTSQGGNNDFVRLSEVVKTNDRINSLNRNIDCLRDKVKKLIDYLGVKEEDYIFTEVSSLEGPIKTIKTKFVKKTK